MEEGGSVRMGNVEAIGGSKLEGRSRRRSKWEVLKILAVGPIAPHAKHL